MDASQLEVELLGKSVVRDRGVTRSQLKLLLQFAQYYEGCGLLDLGAPRLLRDCCEHGDDCWRKYPEAVGDLSLPWVGPAYEPGGVAVLGMNFNDASGLAQALVLAHLELRDFKLGKKRMKYEYCPPLYSGYYAGSDFAYRSTRSAGLVIDFLDGTDIADRKRAEELVGVLESVIRLQAVKCSPTNDNLSAPEREMWANCPPMLLPNELAIARPGFIVGFGNEVRAAIQRLPGFELHSTKEPDLWQGTVPVAGDARAHVFMLYHPRATGYWQASHRSLEKLLRRQAHKLQRS